MEVVKLKNGAEEAEPLVRATMMSLSGMMEGMRGVTDGALRPCDDRSRTGPDGKMHDSVRNFVLSAVTGDGLDMRLGSPAASS